MSGKLEVSFNSPQCGWMSIGFEDGNSEFHTTTAHAPHELALSQLLSILTELKLGQGEYTLKWNRDPEEFDFRFVRNGEGLTVEIFQYPTGDRQILERELVFTHLGQADEVCAAFAATFEQLYADKDTDEFEFNWRQPFPAAEYRRFTETLQNQGT